MPKLTVNDQVFEVETGRRLVLALQDNGVRIGHRCGGNAKCTTCRVEFTAGEPATMTRAEHFRLTDRGLLGQARLACQIVCEHDMSVRPLMTAENMPQWNGDTGPAPAETVTPEADRYPLDELKQSAA